MEGTCPPTFWSMGTVLSLVPLTFWATLPKRYTKLYILSYISVIFSGGPPRWGGETSPPQTSKPLPSRRRRREGRDLRPCLLSIFFRRLAFSYLWPIFTCQFQAS